LNVKYFLADGRIFCVGGGCQALLFGNGMDGGEIRTHICRLYPSAKGRGYVPAVLPVTLRHP
jgi:hypothetical protein